MFPFEIHVTVQTIDIERFKFVCNEIGVKPIVIDLTNIDGTELVLRDVMTSSKITGDYITAIKETTRISSELENNGFLVVRKKIETVPYHPYALLVDLDGSYRSEYFECHFAVKTTPDRFDELSALAKEHNCHRSRNIFKKEENDNVIMMMTKRSYVGTCSSFKKEVAKIEKALDFSGFHRNKTIIEFAIYDTNVNHDHTWIR